MDNLQTSKPIRIDDEAHLVSSYYWLRLIALIVAFGCVVALVFHTVQGGVLHRAFPWNTYLSDPIDRYGDWHNSIFMAGTHDPYFACKGSYFPFAYIVLLLFSGIGHTMNSILFLLISVALVLLSLKIFWKQKICNLVATISKEKRQSIGLMLAVIVVVSYPFQYAIDRGNMDVWVASFCLIYISLLQTRYETVGSVALSIAMAFKGYPAAFCLLALLNRRYLQAVLPIIIAVTITLLSFHMFPGGVRHNLGGMLAVMKEFGQVFLLGKDGFYYTSDPYNSFRILASFLGLHPGSGMLRAYNVATLIFAGSCCYFVLFVPADAWKRVVCVCLLAALFPNILIDYKLLILLPGILYFVIEAELNRKNIITALCLAGLLIPKHYLFFHVGYNMYLTSISVLINPMLLLLVTYQAMGDALAWRASIIDFRARIGWYLLQLLPHPAAVRLRNSSLMLGYWRSVQNLEAL